MIVYGEMLFIENLIIGCTLLYITALIFGITPQSLNERLRVAAGGVMCGLFSMTIFITRHVVFNLAAEATFSLIVCLVTFGKKQTWKKALTFILVTYFMGGMTMGLLLVTRNTGIYTAVGIYTGDMKAAALSLFTGIFLAASKQIVTTVNKMKFHQEHSFEVNIEVEDKMIYTRAYLDTGNCMRDPVAGRPVAVADDELWSRMKAEGMIRKERFCLIPYESIGSKGMLTAVRVDCIEIGDIKMKNCIIARNDSAFDLKTPDKVNYGLLLSKYMTDRGI